MKHLFFLILGFFLNSIPLSKFEDMKVTISDYNSIQKDIDKEIHKLILDCTKIVERLDKKVESSF